MDPKLNGLKDPVFEDHVSVPYYLTKIQGISEKETL